MQKNISPFNWHLFIGLIIGFLLFLLVGAILGERISFMQFAIIVVIIYLVYPAVKWYGHKR